MTKVAISFDDGCREQYDWAKELYRRNIVGTFYINPSIIGHRGCLDVSQLREMHDDMHHTIANHLWGHEAPLNGATLSVVLVSLNLATEWLREKGFADGCDLLALPYGSGGGQWLGKEIQELAKYCKQIRDVTISGVNYLDAHVFVSACESSGFTYIKDKLILHYFHGYHSTSKEEFTRFLNSLASYDVEITSMREIADGKN